MKSEELGWLGRFGFRIAEVLIRLRGARRQANGLAHMIASWAGVWILVLSPFTLAQVIYGRREFVHGDPPLFLLALFIAAPAVWGAISGFGFTLWLVLFRKDGAASAIRLERLAALGFLSGLASTFFLVSIWAAIDSPHTLMLPWRTLMLVTGALNVALALGSWTLLTSEPTEASASLSSP